MRRASTYLQILGGLSVLLTLGCDSPVTLTEDTTCPTPIFYREQLNVDYVSVVGSFNDWDRNAERLDDQNGDRDFFRLLNLEPGRYAYRLYVDGQEILDRTNPLETLDSNGERASLLDVKACDIPSLKIETSQRTPNSVSVFVDISPCFNQNSNSPQMANIRGKHQRCAPGNFSFVFDLLLNFPS